MTLPTHLTVGLLIGTITGDYTTALICSVAVDIDHLIPFIQKGILMKPKELWRTMLNPEEGHIQGQRNILHNLGVFALISAIIILINPSIGLVATIAYGSHLILDMFDGSDYYPLYPSKKRNIRGLIGYFSRAEAYFTSILFIIRGILFMMS